MLGFAGLGKLFKLRPFGGLVRLFGSAGFVGLGGVVALAGLNLQTYKRLTYEREVALVRFNEVGNEANTYAATLTLQDEAPRVFTLKGDEFEMGARVLKFKPMSNMLGYDSVYRVDFLEGRFEKRYGTESVGEATTTGIALSDNPGLDVHAFAKKRGKRFGIADAKYGSAVYNPMGDGLEYKIFITQDALIARPVNEKTRRAIGLQDYPGNKGKN